MGKWLADVNQKSGAWINLWRIEST